MAVAQSGTSTGHLGGLSGNDFSDPLTAMVWFRLDTNHAATRYFMQFGDGVADIWGFRIGADGSGGSRLLGYIVDGGAETDTVTIVSTLTIGKWYHIAMVRHDIDDFEWFWGDETTTTVSAGTANEVGVSEMTGGGGDPSTASLTGTSSANLTPACAVERWKHYGAALTATQIDAERLSLAPSSTTNLLSYNNLDTADASGYTGTLGSVNYTWGEQIGTFSTDSSGPAPSAGGWGPLLALHNNRLVGV